MTASAHFNDTYPVPQRVDGNRVVASYKLPVDLKRRPIHRYVAIAEDISDPGSFIFYPDVWMEPGKGYRWKDSIGGLTYGEATVRFKHAI